MDSQQKSNMKNLSLIALICQVWLVSGQSPFPYNYVSSENTNITLGNYQYSDSTLTCGPNIFSINNTNKLVAKAISKIALSNDLHFGPFSYLKDAEYFGIESNSMPLVFFHSNIFVRIPQNDRFEFGINLQDNNTNQMKINNFINTLSWPFMNDYYTPFDIELFYKTNHHLPEIPSEKEITENGIDVAEMNTLLLKKVEELTIYLVEQQKQINELKKNWE